MKPRIFLFLLSLVVALATPASAAVQAPPNVSVNDEGLGRFGEAIHPDVAAAGGRVYAVWEDNRDRPWDSVYHAIYMAGSTDGGHSWSANRRVSLEAWEGQGVSDPAVAVGPEGDLYIAWYLGNCYADWFDPDVCGGEDLENDVFMARSRDGGNTFDYRIKVWDGDDDGVFSAIAPALAVDSTSGRVYLVVHDYVGGGYNILLLGSNGQLARGSWWQVRVNGQSGSGRDSGSEGPKMAVAADRGVVCIAWEDARGEEAVFAACSSDAGQHFGNDGPVSGPHASHPRLALLPDGTLVAAYQQGENVFLRLSADRGQNWSAPTQVSLNSGRYESLGWDLATSAEGAILILWTSGIDEGYGYKSNLWLSVSGDRGATFSSHQIEDADDIYRQSRPALAVSRWQGASYAFMVWQDDREVEDHIYSAAMPLDTTPPSAPTQLRAVPGDTVVDLLWSPASDASGIAGYMVLRSARASGPYDSLTPLPVTATSYRDVGLDGTPYFYKVYAIDRAGNLGPASSAVQAASQVGTELSAQGLLAYGRDGQVFVNTLPGLSSERPLAQGWAPVFAGDGNTIYYRTGTVVGGSIESRHPDGSSPQTFFATAHLYGAFDIARDGSGHFAWLERKQYTQINPFEIWTVYEPHFGIGSNSLFVDQHEFAESPTISADRRWLAYTSLGYHAPHSLDDYGPSALALADLTAGERKALYNDTHYFDPAFAPAGHTIAFAAYFSGQYEIWRATVNADGSLTDLMQLTRGRPGEWSLAPAWSSDGVWLVFVRGRPAGEANPEAPDLQAPRLYVVRSDGSSLRGLGIAGDAPSWFGGGLTVGSRRVYLPSVGKGF